MRCLPGYSAVLARVCRVQHNDVCIRFRHRIDDQRSEAFKQGLGNGVGRAFERLANYYIKLAEKTFPVIEVGAGRAVDVVITKGVRIEGGDLAKTNRPPTSSMDRGDQRWFAREATMSTRLRIARFGVSWPVVRPIASRDEDAGRTPEALSKDRVHRRS